MSQRAFPRSVSGAMALIACLLLVAGCAAPPAATPIPVATATVETLSPTPPPLPTNTAEVLAPTTLATVIPTDTAVAPTASGTTIPAPTDTILPIATASATQAAQVTQTVGVPVGDLPWKQVGLRGSTISSLAVFPQGNNIVLAASPAGAWLSVFDYTQWQKQKVATEAAARSASASIGSADVMYVSAHLGCASGGPSTRSRTTDGGKTWHTIASQALVIAAANATIAYGITCSGVVKTEDAGATWTSVPGSSLANFDPYALAVSPDGGSLYVAYVSEGGSGRIMMNGKGGKEWSEITPKTAPGEELQAPGNMTFVAGSEGRPQDGGLYMTSAQGLWFLPLESTDWKLIKNAQTSYRLTALYVDTVYTEEYNKPGPIIYTARAAQGGQGETGLGVFRSMDGGASWQSVGKGLGAHVVNSLVLAPANTAANPGMVETLLAATDDGVWSLPMPPPFR